MLSEIKVNYFSSDETAFCVNSSAIDTKRDEGSRKIKNFRSKLIVPE